MSGSRKIYLENMSHCIKTPLNAILGHSDNMMSDMSLSAAHREMIATIHQCGKDMLGMLNDLQDIERIRTGRIVPDETTIDLTVFLKNVETQIRNDRGFSGLIDVRVGERIPRFIVADERWLIRIFAAFSKETIEFDRWMACAAVEISL